MHSKIYILRLRSKIYILHRTFGAPGSPGTDSEAIFDSFCNVYQKLEGAKVSQKLDWAQGRFSFHTHPLLHTRTPHMETITPNGDSLIETKKFNMRPTAL